MFAQLKQGSQIYVLHPNVATPFVEVGIVDSFNNPFPMAYYPNMPTYPLDLSVKVAGRSIPLKRLPTNAESATVTADDGESIIVACSKEAINNEVEMLEQSSIEAVNSVEFHRQRIIACKNLKKQLNPELAEKEAQAQEINTLKSQMSAMSENMQKLMEQNRELMEQLSERTSSRVSKTKD